MPWSFQWAAPMLKLCRGCWRSIISIQKGNTLEILRILGAHLGSTILYLGFNFSFLAIFQTRMFILWDPVTKWVAPGLVLGPPVVQYCLPRHWSTTSITLYVYWLPNLGLPSLGLFTISTWMFQRLLKVSISESKLNSNSHCLELLYYYFPPYWMAPVSNSAY